MTEQKPVQDLKEAVVALTAVAVFAVECVKNGSFDFTKALSLAPKIQLAAGGYENILDQALDIDSAEGVEVVNAVASELIISNEKAKEIILAFLEALPGNIKLIKAVV